ncbi:hypothetical protein A8709_32410 [Paenibacillus pectinilyticus]|uniref:HTH cro/C1-type domain-containing protein n=1 Tax=Paenibacillus pectinilyticus TaxID=512399 RepID=A0A1C0ZWQ2_9BACL|nr:helix-turn-helix transcriptional regulator [Paenibacillus pectinilyticus]OCT12526.1 hypothetical protein A8709_32410 [Paenibacillus pectinilyticus]
MGYAELLSDYIEKSGLSLGEIAIRLKGKEIKIDRSYISKLKNGTKPPASEDVSRAIAEVTGGDPDELILTGYLEKAPEEVKKIVQDNETFKIFLDELLERYMAVPVPVEIALKLKEGIGDYMFNIDENGEYYHSKEYIEEALESSTIELKLNLYKDLTDNGKRLYKRRVFHEGAFIEGINIEFDDTKLQKLNIGRDSQVLIRNGEPDILTDEESEFLKDSLDSFRRQKEKWETKHEIK